MNKAREFNDISNRFCPVKIKYKKSQNRFDDFICHKTVFVISEIVTRYSYLRSPD